MFAKGRMGRARARLHRRARCRAPAAAAAPFPSSRRLGLRQGAKSRTLRGARGAGGSNTARYGPGWSAAGARACALGGPQRPGRLGYAVAVRVAPTRRPWRRLQAGPRPRSRSGAPPPGATRRTRQSRSAVALSIFSATRPPRLKRGRAAWRPFPRPWSSCAIGGSGAEEVEAAVAAPPAHKRLGVDRGGFQLSHTRNCHAQAHSRGGRAAVSAPPPSSTCGLLRRRTNGAPAGPRALPYGL